MQLLTSGLPHQIYDCYGWTRLNELHKLALIAQGIPKGLDIVEVGTHVGRSALALAWGAYTGNGNKVYTIDPHDIATIDGEDYGPHSLCAMYINLSSIGHPCNAFYIGLPSRRAARAFDHYSVGMFYLDGNHDEALEDIKAWRHTFAPGCFVVLHDMHLPQPVEAANFLKNDHGYGVLESTIQRRMAIMRRPYKERR